MIKIYVKEGCPSCETAKQLLTSKDIGYEEYVIGHDVTREEILRMFPNATHAPVIVVNDHFIGGANELQMLCESGHMNKLLLEG